MVAIIVPTMNRSSFVRRLLHYYAHNVVENMVYIADSSDDEFHIGEIKKAIESVSHSIEVVYEHYPKANIEEAKRLILDRVTQEYASYCGDDDFLIPSTLKKCAMFLESNPDYSNCHGTGVCLKMKHDSLYGDIQTVSDYSLLGNEFDDPYMRVYNYLSDYWPIWSVRRVDEFKNTLGLLRSIPVESFREITMGCVPIVQGKTKLLDDLYVVRQVHQNRFQSPDPVEALLLEGWHKSFKEMCTIIANEIKKVATFNETTLDDSVRRGFINYYSAVLKTRMCKRESSVLREIKNFIIRHFPYIEYLYLKYAVPGITLPKLRNQKSRHYDDFSTVSSFLKKGEC
jgi:glycosyltransferase domain-containing protein